MIYIFIYRNVAAWSVVLGELVCSSLTLGICAYTPLVLAIAADIAISASAFLLRFLSRLSSS